MSKRKLNRYKRKFKKNKFKFFLISLVILFLIIKYISFSRSTNKILKHKKTFVDNCKNSEKYNIIIIYVNCLNKYSLGVYQNKNSLTPNIDKFSKNSFVFNNFISPSTYTFPCTYELLTSKKCSLRYTDWEKILKNLSFKNIKENGYNIYLPNYQFGETLNNISELKQPFFVFDHSNYLHVPYDIDLKRAKKKSNLLCDKYSENIKNIRKYSDIAIGPFYNSIFGYSTYIYEKDIKNWNSFKNILIKNSYKLKLLKLNNNKIKESIEDNKKNIIISLNRIINKTNNIFNYYEIIKKQLLKCSNRKNIKELILTNMKQLKLRNILNNEYLVRKNLSNWDNYDLKLVKFYLLAFIFPELENVLNFKINRISKSNLVENIDIFNKYLSFYDNYIPINILDSIYEFENIILTISNEYYKELLRSYYNENLKDVDKRIGNIIKKLKSKNLFNRSIIVIAGDHGEAFFEHKNVLGHGTDHMYNEIISPPLIIKLPNQNKYKLINNVIRTKDIIPTILELCKFNIPKNIDGKSFKEIFENRTINRIAISKGINNGFSIIKNNKWKLIYNKATDKKELYNIQNDPRELYDISDKNKDITAELLEEILKRSQ